MFYYSRDRSGDHPRPISRGGLECFRRMPSAATASYMRPIVSPVRSCRYAVGVTPADRSLSTPTSRAARRKVAGNKPIVVSPIAVELVDIDFPISHMNPAIRTVGQLNRLPEGLQSAHALLALDRDSRRRIACRTCAPCSGPLDHRRERNAAECAA
jgi:hypothetical protein